MHDNFFFFSLRNITLVRADISRLPFATSSIDAVHAGAAIHCWPSPTGAVSIISVLCWLISAYCCTCKAYVFMNQVAVK